MPAGLTELLTLAELSRELRNRGIIKRNRRTLYEWCAVGIGFQDRTVKLNSMRIGRNHYSSVQWFYDFLAEQNLKT